MKTSLCQYEKNYNELWNKVMSEESSEEEKKGCYIATCIYGSYNCPEVWTLRRFRDQILDAVWYGRLFIKFSYAVSPTLVKWFGETKVFRRLFGKMLNRIILRLNKKGVENTEYED